MRTTTVGTTRLGAAAEDQLAELVLPPAQHGADAARVDRREEVQPAIARKAALAEAAATQLCSQRHPET